MLADLTFQTAVLLYPVATVLHVAEEWPRFAPWARRFASPLYSDREYAVTHVLAVAIALAMALLLWAFPLPSLVLLFFALVFGPAVTCNAVFHAGATVVSGAYCAGVISGLVLYLPLSVLLAALALREGLVSGTSLTLALLFAAAFHTLEVGHNVFKTW